MGFRARFAPALLALTLGAATLAAFAPAARALTCPVDYHPPLFVEVLPPVRAAGDSVRLVFFTCKPCVRFTDRTSTSGGIVLDLAARDPIACVTTVCVYDSVVAPLGRLAAGHYRVSYRGNVHLTLHDRATGDSLLCESSLSGAIEFDVGSGGPVPLPLPDLPFETTVTIGRGAACDTCPAIACTGDTIPVVIHGDTHTLCTGFVGVEVIPSRAMTPMPMPPTLRLVFEKRVTGLPCDGISNPFGAVVMIPPLLAGIDYRLPVEVLLKNGLVSPPESTIIARATRKFAVVDTCSSQLYGCFVTRFRVAALDTTRCDAFVAPGLTSSAEFQIGSINPLWGLQGEFVLDPPQLAVTGIDAIGAAVGMHLRWEATPTGAKFVLFSSDNAHLPGLPLPPDTTRFPILAIRVTPRQIDASVPAPRIRLTAVNLLGADRLGHGVEPCKFRRLGDPLDSYFVFCREHGCDFNADGVTDVRDLVGMVRCLREPATCAGQAPMDCDGNGRFELADVFCCARHLLNPGPPGDGRPDPTLRLRFGVPVANGGLLEVPVTLTGASPIGGARLGFRFPDDRYEVRDVVFDGGSDWLGLHEATAGRLDVGLLDLGGATADRAVERTFRVQLALRSGQSAGGEIGLADAEVVDPTGASLIADLGSPSLDLGGRTVSLAPAKPNPFARSTAFAVTLARAGDLEVTVHDVSGRAVATLQHGAAAAGAHTFRWDGVRGDGSRAADGIYFVRARLAGETVSRKVVLLRQP